MREILALLPKPSRYLGIEEGAISFDKPKLELKTLHCALAFPDMYEVGMSYLGQKIIYSLYNSMPNILAERVFTPCREAAKILKEHDVALATLESDTDLAKTHLLGFSITTELAFTNVLYMLDLAKIPLWQDQRGDNLFDYPIVLAGGGCTLCSEPLAPFVDLMALGEGEAMMPEVAELLRTARAEKWTKAKFLEEARFIDGIYVPSLFVKQSDGTLKPKFSDYTKVYRQAIPNLKDAHYPIKQVVPFGAVHNRLSLEIARGCTRGCRFCQAGMTLRPSRERSEEELQQILDQCLRQTGFDDISFLSLSSGDFSTLKSLFLEASQKCAKSQVSISLPSLRVGSVDGEIMQAMSNIRRTGATLAPEAGSQRLRDVINKGIDEEALIHHVRQLVGYGWQQVKLYFMIGLPTETYEDLDAIVELCKKVRDCCRVQNEKGYFEGPRISVTAAISPFVPKTHTPFQWEAQLPKDEMQKRIFYLKDQFRQHKSLMMRWHEVKMSYLEGIISRGGRELAPLLEKAFQYGGIFSTWIDGFSLEPWEKAAEELGINLAEWTGSRNVDAVLPWDHLEAGLSKEFLLLERTRAFQGKLTKDCRYNQCRNCGTCDNQVSKSLLKSQKYPEPLCTKLNQEQRDQEEFGYIPPPPPQNKKAKTPQIDQALVQKAMRYRIWHKKTGQAAFLSQLEVQAFLDRAMRRANLPLAFSQGFHPLPLLTFGMALAVGVESEAEWFAITLRSPKTAQEVFQALAPQMLKGLELTKVELLPLIGNIPNPSKENFLFSHKLLNLSEVKQALDIFTNQDYIEYAKLNKKNVLKTRNIRKVLLNWQEVEEGQVLLTLSWEEGYISPITFMQQIFPTAKPNELHLTKVSSHE